MLTPEEKEARKNMRIFFVIAIVLFLAAIALAIHSMVAYFSGYELALVFLFVVGGLIALKKSSSYEEFL